MNFAGTAPLCVASAGDKWKDFVFKMMNLEFKLWILYLKWWTLHLKCRRRHAAARPAAELGRSMGWCNIYSSLLHFTPFLLKLCPFCSIFTERLLNFAPFFAPFSAPVLLNVCSNLLHFCSILLHFYWTFARFASTLLNLPSIYCQVTRAVAGIDRLSMFYRPESNLDKKVQEIMALCERVCPIWAPFEPHLSPICRVLLHLYSMLPRFYSILLDSPSCTPYILYFTLFKSTFTLFCSV